MGKNFSRNQKTEGRNKNDFYQTPYCLTTTFFKKEFAYLEDIGKPVKFFSKDYCAGKGAINTAIQTVADEWGFEFIRKDRDIVSFSNRRLTVSEQDFFNCVLPSVSVGIMNPPFKLFNKWVERCFEVFHFKFALLAPTTYLQGISRFNKQGTGIFQNKRYPLRRVYTFNRYPMLTDTLRKDGKITTGMQALSWYVFCKDDLLEYRNKAPELFWLDINDYVVRSKNNE